MTALEIRVAALQTIYVALQKAHECGGNEVDDQRDQIKVDAVLDKAAQAAFERWKKAEAKLILWRNRP